MLGLRRAQEVNTLTAQLSRTFVSLAVVVAVTFLAFVIACFGWFRLTADYERSWLAVKAEHAAFAAMLDQESGLRGYLLTHDEQYKEPYIWGLTALAKANQSLATYTVGPAAETRVVTAALVEARLAQNRWIEAYAQRAVEEPAGGPSIEEGKALFDDYRNKHKVLSDALSERRDRQWLKEQRLSIARFIMVFVVLAGLFCFSLWQKHSLQRVVIDPVSDLLEHIKRIQQGNFDVDIVPRGPEELRVLAKALNEMVHVFVKSRDNAEARGKELANYSARLKVILDASREFSESLNLRYVIGAVRASTTAVGSYERVVIWLMDEAQKQLRPYGAEENTGDRISEEQLDTFYGLAGRATKSGRVTLETPGGLLQARDSLRGPVVGISVPLIVGARVVGALEARYKDAQIVSPENVEILEMLCQHAATAIESARLHAVIEERSQMDALTHLLNRRRLDVDLATECKRSARYSRPLAFVMLDVDHFKEFNDTYGHPEGDAALQDVARILKDSVRTTDTAYRYGGEEFCIVMRETSGRDSLILAERVRNRIEVHFSSRSTTSAGVTASFGVAEFTAETASPTALVEAADAALYESKKSGRNRVTLSTTAKRPVKSAKPQSRFHVALATSKRVLKAAEGWARDVLDRS